ncbi:BMP family ABC transporter substrate-binding protein [Metamycoplasma subdolum]|uniref:BMP family ABC transporter substrate-binding protein n=1 Tax=Metamycoplasma subdolum TaxID=92407 RepID=UPI00298D2EAC|nr:BMP family ABC transporter substrate-binding protein [Metamycoplasma subdolum]WPB50489.1 BMP family ABC transporter substrate-binding protein [Metamycoplasma subdolum]
MKSKFFKILLAVSAPLAVATPLVAMSCGKDKNDYKVIEVDGVKTLETLAEIHSIKGLKLPEGMTKENAPRAIFITDEGTINDKSFNQSGWEAVNKVSFELGINTAKKDELINKYIEVEKGKLETSYKQAIDEGFRYIVLCGFTHEASLTKLLTDAVYKKKIVDNKIIFICVYFPGTDLQKAIPGQILPVIFNTRTAEFMAGQATANYLAEKYPGKDNKNKRTVGAFGGIVWPAVSDFIVGFYRGIIEANKSLGTDDKVYSISAKTELETGFVQGSAEATAAVNGIAKAQVLFPVAGSITIDAVERLRKDGREGQVVIGVDADQSKAFEDKVFFSSVLKKVGQAIYTTIAELYTKQEKNLTFYPGFEAGKTNATALSFGYDPNDSTKAFVGIANAALANEADNTIAQKHIDAAVKYYKENSSAVDKILSNEEDKKLTGAAAGPDFYKTLVNELSKLLNTGL